MLDLIRVVARIAVPLIAFSVGLASRSARGARLWHQRSLLLRSLLAVLVLVPLAAYLMTRGLDLQPPLIGGLLVSAISIGPVAAMRKSRKVGGEASYALGLNVVLLVLSIVYVPLAVAGFAALYGRALWIPPVEVAKVIGPLQFAPLILGILFGRLAPKLAARVERPVTIVANGIFAGLVAVVLIGAAKPILGIGVGGLLAVASLAVVAVVLGHLLGGPEEENRIVLAAFTTLRFPALALLLANAAGPRVAPIVMAYVVLSTLVVVVYVFLEKAARRARASRHPLTTHG